MNILITGGTGFVGSALSQRLLEMGHAVTVIGQRSPCCLAPHPQLTSLSADTTRPGDWQKQVPGQDALINLTGRSIFRLWTKNYKKIMYNSRILTTKNLVAALPTTSNAVLLSASAAGYYGDGGDIEKTEISVAGTDFLAQVCRDWEAEASKATEKGARVVLMRFGVVLGKGGGALAMMKTPFQLALGGPIGNGAQWFPWIHLDDLILAILFLLTAEECQGPFNFAAPQAIRQKDFARQLGAVLHRPACLPSPAFIMKGVLGEFGCTLLQGQKLVPQSLNESGYLFTYPEIQPALREIIDD